MATINQVQQRMAELGSAEFQKLVEAYLQAQRVGPVHPIGSKAGQSKTRTGTPDSLVLVSDGTYWFAECTTQKDGAVAKFLDDLDKCLSEAKTGIPKARISKVLFFANFDLATDQIETLRQAVQAHEKADEIHGLSSLSHAIRDRFPFLVRNHLQLSLDTGQILPLDHFIDTYGRNKLATPLTTKLIGRDQELKAVLEQLELHELVILSGSAGTGKTRLALEAARLFVAQHPEFEAHAIFSKGQELFDDFQARFAHDGCFLVVADDANRQRGLDYLVDAVVQRRPGQQFKIVVTVRDYARGVVLERAKPIGEVSQIALAPLDDDQIRTLAANEFDLRHPIVCDRIVSLSKGNPRLAMMVCQRVKDGASLDSVNDISGLYDFYFEAVLQDLQVLGDHDLLRVAGLVAWLRSIDREDETLMKEVLGHTGLTEQDFWRRVRELADMELFDQYEDRIVKVADQVLATYLAYRVFFVEGYLDLTSLFLAYLPRYPRRLLDTINPIFNSFYRDEVSAKIVATVRVAFQHFRETGDRPIVDTLLRQYGVLVPTETLLELKDRIESSPKGLPWPEDKKLEAAHSLAENSPLDILSHFRGVLPYEEAAIELVGRILAQTPELAPQVLRLLTAEWGFNSRTRLEGYEFPLKVLTILEAQVGQVDGGLSNLILLAASSHYLGCHVSTSESRSARTVTIIDFDLHPTEHLKSFREEFWKMLFRSAENTGSRRKLYEFLNAYPQITQRGATATILGWDAAVLIPWVLQSPEILDPASAFAVNRYLDYLDEHQVNYLPEVRELVKTDEESMFPLLVPHRWRFLRQDWDEDQERAERVSQLTKRFLDSPDHEIDELFAVLDRLWPLLDRQSDRYNSVGRINDALSGVVAASGERFLSLLDRITATHMVRDMDWTPVASMVSNLGPTATFQFLSNRQFPGRNLWLLDFFQDCPEPAQSAEHVPSLIKLFATGTLPSIHGSCRFLVGYSRFQEGLIPRIFRLLLARPDRHEAEFILVSLVLRTAVEWDISTWFSQDQDLIEKAYFIADEKEQAFDYEGKLFLQLVDLCPGFVDRYLHERFDEDLTKPRRARSHRDSAFLWTGPNIRPSLLGILLELASSEPRRLLTAQRTAEFLFRNMGDQLPTAEVQEHQNSLLREAIAASLHSPDAMYWLFDLIAEFGPDRRRSFVEFALSQNVTPGVFGRLPLISSGMSWSGSAVPEHQRRIDYLLSLLPFTQGLRFIEHRKHVEDLIHQETHSMEWERRRDFLSDD